MYCNRKKKNLGSSKKHMIKQIVQVLRDQARVQLKKYI